MITLAEVLEEQNRLDEICKNIPLKTPEIFDGNAFYGHDYIIKQYSQLNNPLSLKGSIPHGVETCPKHTWEAELTNSLPIVYYYTKEKAQTYIEEIQKRNLTKKLQGLTHPFLYLCKMLDDSTYTKERKGLIFFPSHSTHHVTLQTDWDELAEYLSELETEYSKVTVCIYWKDYLLKRHLPFQRKGLKVVSAGHIYDPLFHFRLYHLLSMHKYASGQDPYGSCLFYAIAAGCSYFISDQIPYSHTAETEEILKRDSSVLDLEIAEKLRNLFGKPQLEISQEQLQIVDYYLGKQYFLSPDNLREHILEYSYTPERRIHTLSNKVVVTRKEVLNITEYPNIVPKLIANSQANGIYQDEIKILYVIQGLSASSGAGRSLISIGKYLSVYGKYKQTIIPLSGADGGAIDLAKEASMDVLIGLQKEDILKEIQEADIVYIHFWNNPEIYNLLCADLPPARLLVIFHTGGDVIPHIIRREWMLYADVLVGCSPLTYQSICSHLHDENEKELGRICMIYGTTDLDRLSNLDIQEHCNFNVGYIGTINFVKMHPHYLCMSSKINIPDIKFILCGNDAANLKQKVKELGEDHKFEFRGYVNEIKSVLEVLDVFGYPLCEDNYSGSELVLQEAMYAGIPPVIFSYGGASKIVIHNHTGLIVDSESEYVEAIEYLYKYPEERKRLGENARIYAKKYFGGENAAYSTHQVYQYLVSQPKRPRQSFWGFSIESGSDLFIESLGDLGNHFRLSKYSQDPDEFLESDSNIAKSEASCFAVLFDWYQNYFPNDFWLSFWSALCFNYNGQNEESILFYEKAIRSGYSHWRIHKYLSEAYQAQLQQTQAQLQQTQSLQQELLVECQKLTQLLQQSLIEVDAMKSSKFWKIRQVWFKLKRVFGLST